MTTASTQPGATDLSACREAERALLYGAPSQRTGSSSSGRHALLVGLLGFPRGSGGSEVDLGERMIAPTSSSFAARGDKPGWDRGRDTRMAIGIACPTACLREGSPLS
jgi:hypothetical protein